MLTFDDIKLGENKIKSFIEISECSSSEIAIVGIAVKLPGTDTIEEFWERLKGANDFITSISDERRKDIEDYLQFTNQDGKNSDSIQGAFLKEIDKFDYNFFNISPKEASLMDPNQRIFLETAWRAIEDAGYGGKKIVGSRTGVFVGFGSDREYKKIISEVEPDSISLATAGNIRPFVASRIAHLLDLKGPNMIIDTTCSSSLVALHQACQSMKNGECELAIVGGVQIHILPFREGNIGVFSYTSRTKTFDDSSDGTGTGEGVIAIVIKPLYRAIKDRDSIYAVIKGSSINHDGSSIGLTAPNAIQQEDVIVNAWLNAGINPETITYIEAHGTGTKLGDPIEVEGIKRAFERYTNKKNFCAIGSVKSNMGHLDCCAGLAGLVKSVLALKYKMIPPTLHFSKPNRSIDFINSPIYVNDKLTFWERSEYPRRCGISGFGITGTNCHVILEECSENMDKLCDKKDLEMDKVLTISANCEDALSTLVSEYLKMLKKEGNLNLKDICYVSSTARGHYRYRIGIVFTKKEELILKLEKLQTLKFVMEDGLYCMEHKIISDSGAKINSNEYFNSEIRTLTCIANDMMNEFIGDKEKKNNYLNKITELYAKGADVKWELLYKNEDCRNIKIPVYPFRKKRAWIHIPRNQHDKSQSSNMYQKNIWIRRDLEKNNRQIINESILLFNDNGEKGKQLAEHLRINGIKVIEINLDNEYRKEAPDRYSIRLNEEDFIRLFIDINGVEVSHIINMQSLNFNNTVESIRQLEEKLDHGFFSTFYTLKGFLKQIKSQNVKLILVSEYANEVSENQKYIFPENAALFGLGLVASQEYSNIKCTCIDIDDIASMKNVYEEILAGDDALKVAYRDGKRFVEVIEDLNIEEYKDKKILLKSSGIYIITGGTGGIALEIANFLVSNNKNIKLALLSRTKLPEHCEWKHLEENANETKRSDVVKKILSLEKKGAEIEYISVDVSQEEDLTEVIHTLKQKYGKINGIIHCAGVADGGLIISKEKNKLKRVIDPKIYGTWLLDKLTQKENLDFFILFSSLASIIGGIGQGDYSAANAFLDSFGYLRNRRGLYTLTINWSGWRDTGMAKNFGVNVDTVYKIMDTSKAIGAFQKVFSKNVTKVIIGELNYEYDLFQKNETLLNFFSDGIKENVREYLKKASKIVPQNSVQKDVKLIGKDKYSEIEMKIALIWQEVLGYEELNVHDNFFEIGGDSILIIKVHSMIEIAYPGKISVTDLFAYPTIAKLSEHILSSSSIYIDMHSPESKNIHLNNDKLEDRFIKLFDEIQSGKLSIDDGMQIFKDIGVDYE